MPNSSPSKSALTKWTRDMHTIGCELGTQCESFLRFFQGGTQLLVEERDEMREFVRLFIQTWHKYKVHIPIEAIPLRDMIVLNSAILRSSRILGVAQEEELEKPLKEIMDDCLDHEQIEMWKKARLEALAKAHQQIKDQERGEHAPRD